MLQTDAVVIGAGHNGLVCAFHLARAGLRVQLLERRAVVGGAAVTEEFAPGFRNSTASYTVSLLSADVIRAMDLPRHGLRIVPRPEANFLPLEDGRYLLAGTATAAEFAKFSARDAQALPDYEAGLQRVADVVRTLAGRIPPSGRGGPADLLGLVEAAAAARGLSLADRRQMLTLFTGSAAEFLSHWFESEPVQALFGFDSIVGTWASPFHPGTAYVLLHHVLGEVHGVRGAWGHAIGGMGAITQAMQRACLDEGVAIATGAEVSRVLVVDGRARGVELADGRLLAARLVIANVGPKLLFGRLVPADALPPDFRAAIARFRTGSASFRMNVALSGLPRFAARPEPGPHLAAGILLAPSLAWMDRAFLQSRADGLARDPIVEMLIPSLLDPTLAPPGMHVASLFAQHFAPHLPDGRSWQDERDAAADAVLDVVERFAPGFRRLVIGQVALSPEDLEARFGLVDGDIFHGAMRLDQLWAARPVLGHGDYRTPIEGLWLCGAGAHPGGGVTGLPGRNAARAILKARRFRLR
ncbi:MAG: NAD(P)/FAD-dependent oxidoreductase [Sphingomonadaceae bacterium]